jgi:hypothetical protein
MDKNVNTTNKTVDIVVDSGNDVDRKKSVQNIGLYVCMSHH